MTIKEIWYGSLFTVITISFAVFLCVVGSSLRNSLRNANWVLTELSNIAAGNPSQGQKAMLNEFAGNIKAKGSFF